jgi:hypothetical protein
MGGKSKPPPPPDYAALAQQQGAANKETATTEWLLNNSPQQTPWGSRQVVADPTSPSGYRVTESINEQDQQNLDAQRAISGQLLGIAPQAVDSLKGIIGQGINTDNLPSMVSGVNTGGLEKLNANIPAGQYGFNRGQVQGDLNFSGLNPLESGEAVRGRVEQSAFDKFLQRAQPQFDRQNKALDTRIANMGGNTSSPAARLMREENAQNQNDAMTNASFDAVLRGGEEASRQFGMGLQGRQQGVGEIAQQGAFRNQAQGQDFGQLSELANLWNSTRGQDFGMQQDQQGFNNNVTQQNIGNAFTNANLQNSSRTAGLSEIATLRQMPLNEIMAMLSGTQVNAPQFQQAIPTQMQAAPIYQAGKDSYDARVAAQNAQSASKGGMWGALGSVAGSFFGPLGTAAGGALGNAISQSDRRLKSNIARVGTTPGGTPVYEYDIHGRRERGVMADEVPHARLMGDDGYWLVDYSKVT